MKVKMNVADVFYLSIVRDSTKIHIIDSYYVQRATGQWFQDNILKYASKDVKSLTWRTEENEVDIFLA